VWSRRPEVPYPFPVRSGPLASQLYLRLYSGEMTAGERTVRVGPKGQVVVPKRIRDRLGIEPGDEVVVYEEGGEARVRKLLTLEELKGIFGPPTGMADWDEEKRRERELEDRKDQELEDWLNRS